MIPLAPISSNNTVSTIEAFLGYDHSTRINEAAFFDEMNLSSDLYPVLTTRNKRETVIEVPLLDGIQGKAHGIFDMNGLCFVAEYGIDDTEADHACLKAYFNGEYYDFVNDEDIPLFDAERYFQSRKICCFGSYLIYTVSGQEIGYNKTVSWYINTANPSERGTCGKSYVFNPSEGDYLTVDPCDQNGNEIAILQSYDEPQSPAEGDYWTVPGSGVLKKYNGIVWNEVKECFFYYTDPFMDHFDFKAGEEIFFSDAVPSLPSSAIFVELKESNGETHAIFKGKLLEDFMGYSLSVGIAMTYGIPEVDFLIDAGNRLWGCKYGVNITGDFVNQIYCSALGDFKTWYKYDGDDMAWFADLGTDGPFTGAVNYNGVPIFFKEKVMHRVYGSYPSNFQIDNIPCNGIQEGSDRSLCTVDGVLYYLGVNGICAYDGSSVAEGGNVFGRDQYKEGIAGAHHHKYYISMAKTDTDERRFFCYDTASGIWNVEDDPGASEFQEIRGDLYYCLASGNKVMRIIDTEQEKDAEWYFVSGEIGLSSPAKKYISRINLRLSVDVGARADVLIQYDSNGSFQRVATITGTSLRSVSLPIRIRRCDHFRIRMEGKGIMKLYGITKTISEGSYL